MIPKSKPRAPLFVVQSAAMASWHDPHTLEKGRGQVPEFYMLFVRGYYRDSMGKVGVNDRGIYDDACFVVGPDVFASFRANADPSRHRKGVASLIPGWYPYRPGNHGISRPGGGYPAFRPATRGEVLPVTRDGEPGRSKRDGIAINIHRGGYRGTSSEGCLTIYPAEWDAFHALVTMELRRLKLKTFWVGLIEGPIV
jgi:lysozyme